MDKLIKKVLTCRAARNIGFLAAFTVAAANAGWPWISE